MGKKSQNGMKDRTPFIDKKLKELEALKKSCEASKVSEYLKNDCLFQEIRERYERHRNN